MDKKINLYQVRDFGENFSVLLDFLKQNYKSILKGAVFFLPISLVAAYFMVDYQKSAIAVNAAATTNPYEVLEMYGEPKFWIAYLLIFLSQLGVYAYTACYMVKYTETESLKVEDKQVWNLVKRIFLPAFLASILYFLAFGIGLVFCLIPGLILGIYLLFYMYVYAAEEGTTISTAFSRSWDLVRDNWFITFGFILIVYILVLVVGLVFNIPSFLTGMGIGLGIDFFASDMFLYISLFVSYAGSLMVMPILFIAIGVLYFSRRSDHDDIQINDNIDQIGTHQNNDSQYY